MCSRINLPSPTQHLQHTEGLRHRLKLQAQGEIAAARARGDHQAAELLILRQVNYPAWVREQAKASAAAVAAIPLDERASAPASAVQSRSTERMGQGS